MMKKTREMHLIDIKKNSCNLWCTLGNKAAANSAGSEPPSFALM